MCPTRELLIVTIAPLRLLRLSPLRIDSRLHRLRSVLCSVHTHTHTHTHARCNQLKCILCFLIITWVLNTDISPPHPPPPTPLLPPSRTNGGGEGEIPREVPELSPEQRIPFSAPAVHLGYTGPR